MIQFYPKTNLSLRFDFSVYGAGFDVEEVQKLQETVRRVIEAKLDVERKVCDIEEALVRDEVRRLEHSSIVLQPSCA